VTKSVFPDQSSSSVTTRTATSCYTVTACTGSSTTKSTTISTTTTIEAGCGKDGCGIACNTAARRKRGVFPTGVPKLDHLDALGDQFETSNLTVLKRDVPPPGSLPDRDDFHKTVRETALKLDIFDEKLGETAVIEDWFFETDKSYLIEGLYGCLGVIVISHTGEYQDATD
jgi:hypothetical protein